MYYIGIHDHMHLFVRNVKITNGVASVFLKDECLPLCVYMSRDGPDDPVPSLVLCSPSLFLSSVEVSMCLSETISNPNVNNRQRHPHTSMHSTLV